MLSVKALKDAESASHYFEKDNYYLAGEQASAPSRWWGKTAATLGLEGSVAHEPFLNLLKGELPGGQKLGVLRDGEWRHRPGYDLTFSAPKSVSILALVGQDTRLITAHEKAVNTALSAIEAVAAQARVYKEDVSSLEKTGNLAVALFRHDTSRELDPQLHTHAVVLNVTQRSDGKFRSLASLLKSSPASQEQLGFLETVHANQRYFGNLYRSALAYEVTQLGYTVEAYGNQGFFDIVGVPQEVKLAFSQRRQQIEAKLAETGQSGAKAAADVTLTTRPKKEAIDRETLQTRWAYRTATLLFNPEPIIQASKEAVIDRSLAIEVSEKTPAMFAQEAVLYAAHHLAEREAIFTLQALKEIANSHSLGQFNPAHLEKAIQEAYEKQVLVRTPWQQAGFHCLTTVNAMALEKQNIALMQAGQFTIPPVLSKSEAHLKLQDSGLTRGQSAAAELILTAQDRVVGVQGYAGTGKTTLLKTVKALAESVGYTMHGIAPSAAAANQLRESADIPSQTLESFLAEKEPSVQKEHHEVPNYSHHLYVLDESSMASSRQFNELLKRIHQLGVRCVLIGDTQQLGAVEAGKPFEQLQKAGLKTAYMTQIQRQKNPALLQAVHASIQGDISSALNKIAPDIHIVPERDDRLQQIAEDYLNLPPEERVKTLVLTPANQDRHDVNTMIRRGLQQEEIISRDETTHGILIRRSLTLVEQTHVKNYEKGDVVRFNKTYKSLGVDKGDYWTVKSIDKDTKTLTLTHTDGREISWQPDRVGGRRRGAIEVYQIDNRPLAVGDSIRWTRNDKPTERFNAESAEVMAIQADRSTAMVKLANGKLLSVDFTHSQNHHWDYAYATTVYGAQGKTCQRVLGHDESFRLQLTNQRAFYVALSRAQLDVHLYIDDLEKYIEQLKANLGEKSSALDVFDLPLGQRFTLPPQFTTPSLDKAQETEENKENVEKADLENSTHKDPNNVTPLTELTSQDNPAANLTQADVTEKESEQRTSVTPSPSLSTVHPRWDMQAIYQGLTDQAETIIEKLLGPANPKLSTKHQWRYGKQGSFSVNLSGNKRGLWHSFESGEGGNLLQLIEREYNVSFKDALAIAGNLLHLTPTLQPLPERSQPRIDKPENDLKIEMTDDDKEKISWVNQLVEKTRPIEGTLAARYLKEHRGIEGELPESFRFHPGIKDSNTQNFYPALVVIAKNLEGETQATQTILLNTKTAQKADIDINKRTQGRLKFGAFVTVQEGQDKILLAEGPETALSVAKAMPGATVLATLSVSNFANIQLPVSKEPIIICTDNDGENAASNNAVIKAIDKLAQQGHDVYMAKPIDVGNDFNDVHQVQGLDAVKTLIGNATLIKQADINLEKNTREEITEKNPNQVEEKSEKKPLTEEEKIQQEALDIYQDLALDEKGQWITPLHQLWPELKDQFSLNSDELIEDLLSIEVTRHIHTITEEIQLLLNDQDRNTLLHSGQIDNALAEKEKLLKAETKMIDTFSQEKTSVVNETKSLLELFNKTEENELSTNNIVTLIKETDKLIDKNQEKLHIGQSTFTPLDTTIDNEFIFDD